MSGRPIKRTLRGTRCRSRRHGNRRRFIPARAGNTAASLYKQYRHTVHPRPRGEHNPSAANPFYRHGSSPPARGTL